MHDEGPYSLINMDNIWKLYPSSNQTSKNLTRTHMLRGEERQATIFSPRLLKYNVLFKYCYFSILYPTVSRLTPFKMLEKFGTNYSFVAPRTKQL